MKAFNIVRLKNNEKEILEDIITEEISLAIEINEKEIITLLCSKNALEELTTGYLYVSGIIDTIDEIKSLDIFCLIKERWIAKVQLKNNEVINNLKFKEIKPSGCGKGSMLFEKDSVSDNEKITSDIRIESAKIFSLMKDFQQHSQEFKQTGGVHSAALVDKDRIIVFREDIGRHNAIDKIIGNMILNNQPVDNKILLTSGRISSEILYKILKCKIPILITKSAPTNVAVETCREKNITLVGFVRGNKMNIYSGEQRVIRVRSQV